jgi:hypothetical protein
VVKFESRIIPVRNTEVSHLAVASVAALAVTFAILFGFITSLFLTI